MPSLPFTTHMSLSFLMPSMALRFSVSFVPTPPSVPIPPLQVPQPDDFSGCSPSSQPDGAAAAASGPQGTGIQTRTSSPQYPWRAERHPVRRSVSPLLGCSVWPGDGGPKTAEDRPPQTNRCTDCRGGYKQLASSNEELHKVATLMKGIYQYCVLNLPSKGQEISACWIVCLEQLSTQKTVSGHVWLPSGQEMSQKPRLAACLTSGNKAFYSNCH